MVSADAEQSGRPITLEDMSNNQTNERSIRFRVKKAQDRYSKYSDRPQNVVCARCKAARIDSNRRLIWLGWNYKGNGKYRVWTCYDCQLAGDDATVKPASWRG